MTTILLSVYLRLEKKKWFFVITLLLVYLTIEGSFLIANMYKFVNGGWVTILIATVLLFIMYVWFKGREIKKTFLQFVKIDDYKNVIVNLSKDQSLPKYASNLVYLTKADLETDIESKIIYSIIHKRPKRADTYWLIHIHIVDEPRTMEYTVCPIVPDVIIRVEFRLGYKVDSRINLYFKQVLDDLVANKEFDITSKYQSLHDYNIMSDFRFVVIERIQNYDFDFKTVDQFIMDAYYLLKKTGISDVKAFGLDTSNVEVELVPLIFNQPVKDRLKRIT
jgi:KUP system potassium uptake protein